MSPLKRTILIATTIAPLSLVIAIAYAKHARTLTRPALGIEIALAKPFYVPAATSNKVTTVVIRVPVVDHQRPDAVSAIKLETRMENDKVSVTVYALVGEAGNIKTCHDWDALKATKIDTYVAGVDEEVALYKLREYGVSMGDQPLTYRVVPKRTLSPLPQHEPVGSGGCDCASCGGLICCPNPGYCLSCGSCGSVCCSGG